jgi:hypothetical protein
VETCVSAAPHVRDGRSLLLRFASSARLERDLHRTLWIEAHAKR